VRLSAQLSAQIAAQLERLGDRHLGGLGHRQIDAAVGILHELAHLAGLTGDRPDTGDPGVDRGGRQRPQYMSGERRPADPYAVGEGAAR
jgi:hypothetical protein